MKKGIYSTKVLQSLILASALCLSTSVLASSDADNGGVAADRGSAALGITESLNTDDSTDVAVADSGNGNDLSTDVALTDSFKADNSTDDDVVVTDAFKQDNSTDVALTDSFKADNSTDDDVVVDVALTDSFNDNSDNSTDDDVDVAVTDSFNVTDSFKADSSVSDSNNTTIGDIAVAVAFSELDGVVTDNYIDVRRSSAIYTGNNKMLDSMNSPAGITQVSMNTGFQSLTQQSVNIQGNINP